MHRRRHYGLMMDEVGVGPFINNEINLKATKIVLCVLALHV